MNAPNKTLGESLARGLNNQAHRTDLTVGKRRALDLPLMSDSRTGNFKAAQTYIRRVHTDTRLHEFSFGSGKALVWTLIGYDWLEGGEGRIAPVQQSVAMKDPGAYPCGGRQWWTTFDDHAADRLIQLVGSTNAKAVGLELLGHCAAAFWMADATPQEDKRGLFHATATPKSLAIWRRHSCGLYVARTLIPASALDHSERLWSAARSAGYRRGAAPDNLLTACEEIAKWCMAVPQYGL